MMIFWRDLAARMVDSIFAIGAQHGPFSWEHFRLPSIRSREDYDLELFGLNSLTV